MFKKVLVFVIIGAFILGLGLAGCGKQADSPDGQASEEVKELIIGSDTAFAPFEYQDEKSQEYVGFDMDLIEAIGQQMGYEVNVQGMPFDGLIPGLEAGSIDAVISAMTITEERAKKVNFSKPYYKSGLTIVVKSDNTTIKSFEDLEGKKIAVQIGTTGSNTAKTIKDAEIREFNTAPEAFLELKAGGVDAVINDKPVNDYYITQMGGKDGKTVGEPLTAEDYGIATAKKNTELAQMIDNALEELRSNGEYAKIYEKWFGKEQ
ncbi:MAG: basic amino acid ABC transporter substrate-binding protein [Ignavibacteriae bacterium HGW-Ignavibacteriae-4]|jgi:polar amino acid transport system substrate-binding protein|nr:MAG: basic amino acid ABC transporter substrate-binding protein [Ignavibacteriae bacterium HGW-Ignavibacteriae-4]